MTDAAARPITGLVRSMLQSSSANAVSSSSKADCHELGSRFARDGDLDEDVVTSVDARQLAPASLHETRQLAP